VTGFVQIENADRRLLASLEASLAEAARRSGPWLVCRPGCTECCIGPFAITQLDALRLRRGLRELQRADPERACRLRNRARNYVSSVADHYPGDPVTGELWDEEALPPSFDSLPCPALDPQTGLCDLYEWRPVTCRTFGPATRVGHETFAACHLCYHGATEQDMVHCAVELDPDGLECEILARLESQGIRGMTLVAFALAHPDDC
jgi:Fe-S-cluster containining protein